jgi:lipopolysaccharide transport system permease protein
MLMQHRELLYQLIRRDIAGRYRGSVFGIVWALINPLLLLGVYSLVFMGVFKARWGTIPLTDDQHTVVFPIILFSGLMLHMLLAECLSRAPSIILQNENLVKKVIFPLEIFPIVILGTALFHFCMHTLILCTAILYFMGSIPLTALYLPLILFPFCLSLLGASWLLASLGVFVRDIGQVMQLIITLLMFLSPVFYPMSALPEAYHILILLNPLTFIIEQTRDVLLWGKAPNWSYLCFYSAASCVVFVAGYWWFQKTRKGFADVL